jgi:hypothetical protein
MAMRLLPLALLLVLWAAAPPGAAAVETPVGDVPVLALEEEEPEAEAAEEVEGGCEEADEAFEECEEAGAASQRPGEGRDECVLRSARAHGHFAQQGKKLKLTIGYTASEPVKAKIEVGRVGTLQRHLGRSGVLRITKRLGARAGNRLVVRIEIPSARNAGCPFRRFVLSPR